MTQLKKTTTFPKITQILLIIAIITLCPIVNATQNLPQDPNNPNNNYIICSTDPYIAYTKLFLQNHPNNLYPTIEFGGLFYITNHPNDSTDNGNEKTLTQIHQYITDHSDYLIQNPNAKITVLTTYNDKKYYIDVATSYANRDKYSNYPGDLLIATNTNRGPDEPKPENEITVYIHKNRLQKNSYQIHPNNLKWFKIENPKYPDFSINPIFGQNQIYSYSTQFINSHHYTEKTIQIDGYTYYKTNPNIETILDYIFTQSPYLLNNPGSKIFLNIKDNSWFINREIITQSRELTPNEITKYHYPTEFPSQNSIATNLHSLPDDDIIITKTPGTDNQFGVFIKTETLKKLEPGLASNFKWISTLNHNRDDGWIENTGWLDTIYKSQ